MGQPAHAFDFELRADLAEPCKVQFGSFAETCGVLGLRHALGCEATGGKSAQVRVGVGMPKPDFEFRGEFRALGITSEAELGGCGSKVAFELLT